MATMYMSEYADTVKDASGLNIQAGIEPALVERQVDFTGAAGLSPTFNVKTRFVRITVDTEAYLLFGVNPVATVLNSGKKIQANVPEFFGVTSDNQVSAITA